MSYFLFASILLSLAVYGGVVTPIGAVSTLLGLALMLLVMASLIAAKRATSKVSFVFVLLWVAAAVHLLVTTQWATLALTHALPFAIIAGAVVAIRSLQWVGRVPFIVPVGFIIVLAPLLTEDPWRLATAAGSQLYVLAPVAIPLTLLTVISILKSSPLMELSQASIEFERIPHPEKTVAKSILKFADAEQKAALREVDIEIAQAGSDDLCDVARCGDDAHRSAFLGWNCGG